MEKIWKDGKLLSCRKLGLWDYLSPLTKGKLVIHFHEPPCQTCLKLPKGIKRALTFLSYFCTKSPNLAVTDPFEMLFHHCLLSFPPVTQITAATCIAEAQPQAGCICQAAMEELRRAAWFRGHGRRRHWRYCTWDHHRACDCCCGNEGSVDTKVEYSRPAYFWWFLESKDPSLQGSKLGFPVPTAGTWIWQYQECEIF